MQRNAEPSTLKTICATEATAFWKEPELFIDEHWMSTLQDPARPMSERVLSSVRPAGLEKRCATFATRGSLPASRLRRGSKNSTVSVSPGASGDHHGVARSAMSPTR